MKRKFCIMIFNRATYSRSMCLIDVMESIEEFEVTLILGSGLLDDTYGKGALYIRRNHKNCNIIEVSQSRSLGVNNIMI